MTRRSLGAVCLLVLGIILVAGLWPFHAPKNEVRWLSHSNGLDFSKHGSIVSVGVLKVDQQQTDHSCSLEIWLEPSPIEGKGTILGFYWPKSQVVPFSIRQYQNGLVLEHPNRQKASDFKAAVFVDRIFSHPGPVLVTISSDGTSTSVYADGALLRKFAAFGISSHDLTGRFVIANSPSVPYDWSGKIRGFALYDRELTAEEVSQHLRNWTTGDHPDVAKPEGLTGLYLFNEGQGNVVHNQVTSATDLIIPERFFVLHEQFLERPWDEYRPGWRYWKNIGVNVVGFIPLGFFFYAYFASSRTGNGSVAKTIALGFIVSLTIEVLQAFLPTRDSGMTDLFTNTLGTAIGVILVRYGSFHSVLSRMEFRNKRSSVCSITSPSRDIQARDETTN
jgi:VanZ like family/Concanavalin A-like lectin/glucanases superfamily